VKLVVQPVVTLKHRRIYLMHSLDLITPQHGARFDMTWSASRRQLLGTKLAASPRSGQTHKCNEIRERRLVQRDAARGA
jgi:hypothetical protein